MRMTENAVLPHGGDLKNLMPADDTEKEKCLVSSLKLKKHKLSTLEFSDLIMLGIGAFSPLDGFMNQADYISVLGNSRLENGILWPLPVTLSVESKDKYKKSEGIALTSPYDGQIVGTITVQDIFKNDKEREALSSFGTTDENHPGAAGLYKRYDYYLSGRVTLLSEGGYPEEFPEYARPTDTREIFAAKGWKSIVAFQTRNPIHRSHEYLTKVILETYDGLFIHPIVGKLKDDDIPADIRMKCYKALLENYYPADRVLLKVYPMEMRYAGPKEAILHAIIRQNYGCSHIIIGRDHAGVGKYYGPFDAQKIFDTLTDTDLVIKPVCMDWTFYCSKCDSLASYKSCPHPDSDHILISGTKLRDMLSKGEYPPDYITRKEVSDILMDYYKSLEDGK